MLHTELILKGSQSNYSFPDNFLLGKFLIDCQRKKHQDDIFCVDGITNEVLTSGQYVQQVLKVAGILREMGTQEGDVLAIVSENSFKFIIVYTAILYIGAVVNPINPVYKVGELKNALNSSRAKTIFCSKAALTNVKETKSELDFINKIILMDTTLEVNITNIDTLDALLEDSSVDVDTVKPAEFNSFDHVALILLSSGTTGLPKSVMLTHQNLRNTIGCFGGLCTGISSTDVTIGMHPFFHILGLGVVFVATLSACTLIVLPSFIPEIFLRCIQDYKVSLLYTVPPIIGFLTKNPLVKNYNLESMQRIFCGGAPLGNKTQSELLTKYPGREIMSGYGITETAGVCTYFPRNSCNKSGSVGMVVPDAEMMVWSADLCENIKAFEIGELCFKTPTLMKGYIGIECNDIDEYGFYHTGDVGYFDEDGYCYIVGRMKELIKYKGFQVAPAEIEDLLLKHPAVKECAVIGVPDETAGQLPTALVVCQNEANITENEIVSYIAENISFQKQLHGGVKFINSIPKTASGKILRGELLELYKSC